MKTKIIVSVVLFAAAFVLEGVAGKVFPFDELVGAVLSKKTA